MARSKRIVYFHSSIAESAEEAVKLFNSAAARLGLPWVGKSSGGFDDAEVIVPLEADVPGMYSGRVEKWAGGDTRDAVNGLIARLLGGSDEPVPATMLSPPPVARKPTHTVKLSRETAGRRGKGVTVISDLPLTDDQLKELATLLKSRCGTGGTAKDRRIEIQGDHRDRIAKELEQLGYKVKRAGG